MEGNQPVRLIYRYNEPTKLDTANHKALCKVSSPNQYVPAECEYYIQLSTDSENPRWEKLGSLKFGVEELLLSLVEKLK